MSQPHGRSLAPWILVVGVLGGCTDATEPQAVVPSGSGAMGYPAAELTAPAGFHVSVFHEGLTAGVRHMVVRDNGDVLVAHRDGNVIGLRDVDGDGHADLRAERALDVTTGLAIHEGYLYVSDRISVSRVRLEDGLVPAGEAESVVSGFPQQSSHDGKPLAFDLAGNLYVNVGAPSNACQQEARSPGSPGMRPCPQLERQAAIWRYPAGAVGLDQRDGERYVTGTRNIMALDWNRAADALYFTMHGRDQLHSLWPALFDEDDGVEMPAEEFHRAEAGGDYGWPYTFFDPRTDRRLLAPEYGGDGKRSPDTGTYPEPLYAFPAHWAPNDMVFYEGAQFPARFRGGAFIAWHGSWNRAPQPQEGYRVTFLPLAGGAPSGEAETFLDGFKGRDAVAQPGEARFRPTALAVAGDGSLYVADSLKGRVWRVTYDPGQAD